MKTRIVLVEVKVQSSANISLGRIVRRVMMAPRQALSACIVSIVNLNLDCHEKGGNFRNVRDEKSDGD